CSAGTDGHAVGAGRAGVMPHRGGADAGRSGTHARGHGIDARGAVVVVVATGHAVVVDAVVVRGGRFLRRHQLRHVHRVAVLGARGHAGDLAVLTARRI